MRIFKKKDGSPSGFAKALKGIGKVVGTVAQIAPVPFAGKIGSVVAKVADKVGDMNLAAAAPQQTESIADYGNRVLKGVGGAVAGFSEQIQQAPVLQNNPAQPFQVKQAMTQGYAQNKYGKYALFAAIGIGALVLLKATKIIK